MVIALAVIGIIAVGSAEESLQSRQIAGFVVGVFLMIVLSLVDYSVILNFYWVIYILNLIILNFPKEQLQVQQDMISLLLLALN